MSTAPNFDIQETQSLALWQKCGCSGPPPLITLDIPVLDLTLDNGPTRTSPSDYYTYGEVFDQNPTTFTCELVNYDCGPPVFFSDGVFQHTYGKSADGSVEFRSCKSSGVKNTYIYSKFLLFCV